MSNSYLYTYFSTLKRGSLFNWVFGPGDSGSLKPPILALGNLQLSNDHLYFDQQPPFFEYLH